MMGSNSEALSVRPRLFGVYSPEQNWYFSGLEYGDYIEYDGGYGRI